MTRRSSVVGFVAMALSFGAACSTGTPVQSAPSLAGSWRLVELRSPEDSIGIVRPDDPAKYEMMLAADGTVSMRLDCNRATGRWMSSPTGEDQGTIRFTPLAMTRAACLTESLDTRVARELGFVHGYVMEGDRLVLDMVADGGMQVWMRVSG